MVLVTASHTPQSASLTAPLEEGAFCLSISRKMCIKKEPRGALSYFSVMLLLMTVELYKNSTSAPVKSTNCPTMACIM